ncbi:MAG: DUF493 domain-containing protein [Pseudomonadales bacterium]|jgi:putative lipoic acid-binding regulatory protein|nr:DUF493 domain-containing protein [Pseudomonadales bacterium]MCC6530012.1 DUF493 domain-containing protein [Pseudomonadales bacterium]MCP5332855.1 DUF493 domain-containing protein [Pseudomonadales bacterium]HMU89393.1 DUF493 domain-containing protein [Pseudomonadales bacterium]HMW15237.1 DUF493 domain-containing protein [Pseudomonadales bacterium]
MQPTEPPRIEFPCRYPIKVMGEARDDFADFVVATVSRHAPGLLYEEVSIRPSRDGNYLAVTLFIEAQGEAQLALIFGALKGDPRVRMVL